MGQWRVFWVGSDWVARSGAPDVEGAGAAMRAEDAVFVSPDHRIDPGLCRYGQSETFRGYTAETRRNYATDLVLLLIFLTLRRRHWTETREKDLDDFKDWRIRAPQNPERVGASKWNRELAAFSSLFKWARKNGYVSRSPVTVREITGRDGLVRNVALIEGLLAAAPGHLSCSTSCWLALSERRWSGA